MANLNPEDLPFLLSEEAGGPINRELLRDKWTARTQLFFNNQSYGNRRGARTSDGWTLPNLQLDPAVKYRAFDGQKWGDEILAGHSTSGWKTLDNAPKGVFFNPGVPLWSYAKPLGGSPQFVFATLGEGWGDRDANVPTRPNPSPLDWKEGGSALTTKMQEQLRHFFPSYQFKSHKDILGIERSTKATAQLLDTQRTLTAFINDNHAVSSTIDQLLSLRNKGHTEDTLEQKRDFLDYLEGTLKKEGKTEWVLEAGYDVEVQEYEQQIEEAKAKLLEMKDRTGYDASLDRNDLRRKIELYTDKIRDSKIAYYSREFEKQSRLDAENIFGPKAIGAIKEHLSWLQATVAELNDARAGNNPHLAFSLKTAEEALTRGRKSFSTTGLSFLKRIVEQEEEFKKLVQDIFGNKYSYDGPNANFPATIDDILLERKRGNLSIRQQEAFLEFLGNLTRSFQPSNDNLVAGANNIEPVTQESPYLDYSVSPAPSTFPLVGKDPFALIHEKGTPLSNYFFDERNRPYLLGPGNTPILLNPSDDAFFLDPENVLKNLTNFGAQGIVSDKRRMTFGGLDWAMMGKEGAMYSEQLPGSKIELGTKTLVDKETGGLPRRYVDFKLSDWPYVNIKTADYVKKFGTSWADGNEHKLYRMIEAVRHGRDNPYPEIGVVEPLEERYYGQYYGVRLTDGRLLIQVNPDLIYVDEGRLNSPHAQLEPKVRLRKIINELGGNEAVKQSDLYWYEASDVKTMPTVEVGDSLSVHAASVGTEGTYRPSVLFQIDANSPNGIKVLKEWNNDPTKWGFKPIPTGPLNPDALREAYVRFAQEVIDPIMTMTKDSVAFDEFTRLMKDVKHPEGTPEHQKAVEGALKDANDHADVVIGLNETKKLNKALQGYTNAEEFASRALSGGFPKELFDLMYTYGRTTYDWQATTKTPGYEKIQNIIDESTKGNPGYGRPGFARASAFTRPFSNLHRYLTEPIPMPSLPQGAVVPSGMEIDYLATIRHNYLKNPEYRSAVNAHSLSRLGTVAAVALSPLDSVSRNETFNKFFVESGGTAEDLQKMQVPFAVASGLETAANVGTFGLYDQFSPSPTSKERRNENIDTLRKLAATVAIAPLEFRQYIKNFAKYRDNTQQGIDYPVISGNRFERTTK